MQPQDIISNELTCPNIVDSIIESDEVVTTAPDYKTMATKPGLQHLALNQDHQAKHNIMNTSTSLTLHNLISHQVEGNDKVNIDQKMLFSLQFKHIFLQINKMKFHYTLHILLNL